ncbi:MAG: hypothetical protein EP320_09175 [Rhodobacteraceae bacterium]|uniref:Lipoprotein n=1 Tax=Thioclava marina TaxID=1915077 RepID=A0ABX3MM61_9RHOB|nr:MULTISPECIES: hypothetical protein [Thioclava]OOY12636.1 hypothetical protein BMG00_01960 [Thioclava marina]OOY28652.1 hypothetical protein BMI90_08355 [Thioclava sp. L04-15]TNE83605.1 MAG: hypothetical protein EP337_15450 [Paracoccaceae bacterium]TNF13541.1 MAG: hypothetical protein EP320_09175 [Paracoccaceae bacterium]
MKNLLIILGVTGLLAGCDMMQQPAGSDVADEAAMAAETSGDTADSTSGTHETTNERDREQTSR